MAMCGLHFDAKIDKFTSVWDGVINNLKNSESNSPNIFRSANEIGAVPSDTRSVCFF